MSEVDGNPEQGSATSRPGRTLSTHQKAVLIQVLLIFPDEPVGVCYVTASPDALEALKYAEDFLTIFKAINWSVDRVEAVENLPAVSSGLALVVKRHPPASAEALRDALRIYNIQVEIINDEANLCGSRNFVLAVAHA